MKILILRIILRKLQNSKKNSKNKNVSEYGPCWVNLFSDKTQEIWLFGKLFKDEPKFTFL